MPDYKEMYYKLFRAQTKAIEILTKAGQEAEQMYIESKDPVDLSKIMKNNLSDNDAPEQDTPNQDKNNHETA